MNKVIVRLSGASLVRASRQTLESDLLAKAFVESLATFYSKGYLR